MKFLLSGELLWAIYNSTRNCVNLVLVPLSDVLVSAGCVEPFLRAKRTWCILMFLNVNLKTSLSWAIYVTFTTSETWAIRANVRLAHSTCVSSCCCIVTAGAGYLCSFQVSASVGGGWALGCGDSWAVGCGTGLAAAAGSFLWCLLLWILRAFWSLRALLQRLHNK